LSAETLADLEAQGLAMYDQMIEAGFTQIETLTIMAPWLRTIYDAHKKLGIPIDENTQKLIDQALALGLLDDNDPTSILKQGFKDLIKAVQDLTNALLGIPKTVDTTVTVTTRRREEGNPDPDPDPKDPKEPIPQAFGGSYWVAQPTMFVAGEAGPEYAMFSGANQTMAGRWGSRASGEEEDTGSGSAAAASFTFNITALDPVGMKKVVEEEIAPMLVSVWRRNVSGLRTDTRRELVND
jgi:hypothetical protein